ncbi:MAG: hypothetical protein HON76_08905 [Candidatus Scalindua sp.]|jgi:hypothetical protein|nr:hypothetical protein [Candidatus Scalindua sp.]MBT6052298.1 hypothetical protein [Candidatus Scalindua sp.]MBT6227291.1 hypothetical protein [Candidatus Scalindua sp.]MBT6562634.1 hypothetical protein [Candidatus Scalindua sp.]
MKEESMNISNLITQIRTLCKETAALLKTADSLVEKNGWSTITGSYTTSGNSSSLDDPIGWVPELLYRYYTNTEEYPNKLLYVAVILDNRYDNPAYPTGGKDKLEEPILTAGYFDYGDEKIVNNSVWKDVYCKGYFFSDGLSYDGSIVTLKPENMKCFSDKTTDGSLVNRKLKSLALPLIDIKDTAKIEKSVIQPLLTDMIQS